MLASPYSAQPPPSNPHHQRPPSPSPAPSSASPPPLASSSQPSRSDFSAPDTLSEAINPMFDLSQRVERGQLNEVHVVRATEGDVLVRQGPPPELLHPSTWRDHQGVHSNGHRPLNGKGKERERHSDSDSDSSDSSDSSDEEGGSERLVLQGSGGDAASDAQAAAGGEEKNLADFKDHEIQSSRRDEARMKAHGWKRGWKERIRSKDGSQAVDPGVAAALERPGSFGDAPAEAGAEQRLVAPDSSQQPQQQHETPDTSVSTLFHSAINDLHIPRSESPLSSIPPTFADYPARTESPESMRFTPRSSTPPLLAPSSPDHRDRTPVLNAPGEVLANSRTPPATYAANLTSSPPRLVPTASLTKPLHPHPSNSSLRPPSSSSPSMRRSNTTGSGLFATTSRTSTSSRSPSSPSQPPRALSYHQGSPSADGEGYFQTAAPSARLDEVFDEVESSIAAQAEVIRKQRQEKRAEKEKEAQDQVKGMGVGGGIGSSAMGPGGAPIMKRRSTRAGSGDSNAPGQGVLVGNLIGQDHANYVLMYNMLTGIRIGVSRCQAKLKRELTDADYTARHKFSFDIVGNELTPSTKYDFKFKDYAPWVFRELREYFYLDPSDYLVSLTAKYILSELGSPGKSGSFFYFSRDYRFIIKTIRHSEHKFLRSILKEYHEYIKKNPHTLLSRFYGLHRVKLPRGRKIHFVIMNNLFPPHRDIHETYDLKGSAIGRLYPEDKAQDNPRAILKDLNFVGRDRHFALGPEKKALFEEQLRRDTELMQKLGIMDYSLLTGIHNVIRGNVDNLRDGMLTVFQPDTVKMRRKPTLVKRDADATALRKAVQRSDPKALSDSNKLPEQDMSERRMFLFYQDEGGMRATGPDNEDLGVIYYLGIIDILTPYTFVKRVEHFFKGFKHPRDMISAVPPKRYGDRFLSFIYARIVGNDPSKGPRMYEHDPVPVQPSSEAPVDPSGQPKTKVE